MPPRPLEPESGFTLVEVLVSLVILGVAFAGILAGLGTAVQGSDRHRRTASAETALRTWADAVEAAPYQTSCATAASTSYTVTGVGVSSLIGSNVPAAITIQSATAGSSTFGACANGASMQKVTLVMRSPDWNGTTARDTESVDIVKYKP